MAKSYSVTSAGVNPTEDRAHRMRMYFIAMALRMLCVISLFWLHGWWVLLSAAGAILLPWFAVMVGNAVAYGGETAPDAPEPQQIEAAQRSEDDNDDPAARAPAASETLLVMDAEPVRRSSRAGTGADPSGSGSPDEATRAEATPADRSAASPAPGNGAAE